MLAEFCSGERGIRTPGTLLGYTRFPGELLQPLGHLSNLFLSSVARQCEHRVSIWQPLGHLSNYVCVFSRSPMRAPCFICSHSVISSIQILLIHSWLTKYDICSVCYVIDVYYAVFIHVCIVKIPR